MGIEKNTVRSYHVELIGALSPFFNEGHMGLPIARPPLGDFDSSPRWD